MRVSWRHYRWPATAFRRLSTRSKLILLLALCVALRATWDHFQWRHRLSTVPALDEGQYAVAQVIDDFTLLLLDPNRHTNDHRPAQAQLKLLGVEPIDRTPNPAGWATRQFIANHPVRLRLDRRRIDRDGNLLGYIYVNDELLNEHLVRLGLARVATHPGDSASVVRQLKKAELDSLQARNQ
ncbi:MAG: thermonuclease family protein [Pirellulaceae bacterium]